MAFEFDLDTEATVSVIVSKDSAIKGTSEEAYEKYSESLNESHLTFVDGVEPTRFVLLKTLPYRDSKLVMNSQVTVGENNKPQVNISFIMDEVRCALQGIDGPNSSAYIKDKSDGYVDKKVINFLYNRGVLMDLYNARRNAGGDGEEDVPKKS